MNSIDLRLCKVDAGIARHGEVVAVAVVEVEQGKIDGGLKHRHTRTTVFLLDGVLVGAWYGGGCHGGRCNLLGRNEVRVLAEILDEGNVGWMTEERLDEVAVAAVLFSQRSVGRLEFVGFLRLDGDLTLELGDVFWDQCQHNVIENTTIQGG